MTSFYKLRKGYMTLMETLIAVSLLSIVLVFVFGFFRELAEITHLTDKMQKVSFQSRYLESRLNYVFERIVNENEPKKRPFFFYAEPPQRNHWSSTSLVFTFNNDVRLDPKFSGDVLGRLYHDPDKTLRLAIWPLHLEEPQQYMHEEILLDNVADIRFFFYAAPERIQDDKEIHSGYVVDPEKKMPEKDKWHENDWPITYNQMPSIIKIEVDLPTKLKDLESHHPGMKIDVNTRTYYFVLPSSKNPVQYPPQD